MPQRIKLWEVIPNLGVLPALFFSRSMDMCQDIANLFWSVLFHA